MPHRTHAQVLNSRSHARGSRSQMLSPDVLDDVTEGLVLPNEWAPASVSEFVSWPFKWSRLVTTFDGDGVAVRVA